MLKLAFTLILFLVGSGVITAQTTERGKISGKITDEQQKPIEGATAELLRVKDSSLVKVAISNKSGTIEFENIRFGSYLIKTTYVNRERSFSSIIDLSANNNAITINNITLKQAAKELQTVQVTGRKPFIQQMTDRIVVNVENSVINAGSSAFDVLERSPGVLIDGNDNISMRGKAGVIIMVDGKPSPMSGSDLVNYLRSLPSNAIERIELITNPSARYDAAGNAGIIDIRMKKDQRFGINGSFTAGYGQGIYPKANTGINFNYRNKKVNLFGGFNYSYRMGLNHLLLNRNFYTNEQFTGQDLKDNFTKIPLYLNALRFGADFYPTKKTVY
ncbi:MAG TPA: TonB-dependent receptor, partial [Chitinophagaceae bacterium]|nr:TonB-dependent receptor [Chitinophagaceae bacterium]